MKKPRRDWQAEYIELARAVLEYNQARNVYETLKLSDGTGDLLSYACCCAAMKRARVRLLKLVPIEKDGD